jgi:hypothetical protein
MQSENKDNKKIFGDKKYVNDDGECLTENTDRLIDSDVKQIAFNSIKSIFTE